MRRAGRSSWAMAWNSADVCLASHSARARSPGALWDRARRCGGADGPRGRVQWARAHKTRLRLRLHGEGALRGRAHLHTATVAERECGRGGVSPARRRGVLRVGALWGPGGVPREGDALPALCSVPQFVGHSKRGGESLFPPELGGRFHPERRVWGHLVIVPEPAFEL